MPDTTDDLQVVILEPAVDPDGDPLFYFTRWFHDGALAPNVRGDTVPAERTVAGEYWIAELWATDGQLEGPLADATIYVFNTAPEAEVWVRPERPDTRSDLVAMATATDLDDHDVSFTYSWFMDGVLTDNEAKRVPSADTTKGETWMVEVLPYDGDSWGYRQQASVGIENTLPEAPTLAIEPSQPQGGQDDLRCAVIQDAFDADGDPLEYRVEWRVEGALFEETTSSEIEGDTVQADSTEPFQSWECTVTADDGEGEGRPARVSVVLGR